MLDRSQFDDVDMDAFRRAIEIASRDPVWAESLQSRLDAGEMWTDVGQTASFHCQTKVLKLPPWRQPPCTGRDDDAAASALLDELLDLNLSQWEPSPEAALKAKRRK